MVISLEKPILFDIERVSIYNKIHVSGHYRFKVNLMLILINVLKYLYLSR